MSSLVTLENRTLGELVMYENRPDVALCRDEVIVNVAADTTLMLGAVLAKGATATAFAPAVAADLVAGTAFAIVLGDKYNHAEKVFVPKATDTKILSYVRGPLQLSDFLIKKVNTSLTAAQIETLKTLLKAQGIEVVVAV
jgi:hypothetical protein